MIELLKKRRSCRKFTEKAIEEEKINILLKAALMSPSGKRINPWEYIIIKDNEMLAHLANCKNAGSTFLKTANMAIVVFADTTKTDTWIEDCSIASTLIQLTAESLDLGSCWAQVRMRISADENISTETYVKEALNIPEKYAVESIIGLGYKAVESKPFKEEYLQLDKLHQEKF